MSKIAVDPTNSNIVYAAMANRGINQDHAPGTGIFKSVDAGVTWTNTTTSISTSEAYSDVVIDPSDPNVVYMAIGSLYGSAVNGVYESVNGGGSWSLLSGVPTGMNDGRISIAIAPSDPSVLYVCIARTNIGNIGWGLYAFLRSDDGGSDWTDLTSGTPNFMGSQGFYDQSLAVDPTNPARVYVGGQVQPTNDAVFESTNYGVTWAGIAGDASTDPHTDHHAFYFDASGKLLDGNDGGIWRLDNPDPNNIQWTDLNKDLNTIQLVGIGLHPTDDSIAVGGSQDNGAERFTDKLGWTQVHNFFGPGDAGSVKFSNQNPDRAYRVCRSKASAATSSGSPMTPGKPGPPRPAVSAFSSPSNTNFYPPFAIDPSNGDRLVIGSNQLYETTDGASNWNLFADVNQNGFNPDGETVNAIGLAASDPKTIYAASGGFFASSSHIYVTTNGGTTWTQVDLPNGSGRVSDLEVDPVNSQTVYATVSTFGGGHVFKSTTGGSTWTDISGNLPNLPTWTLQFDPTTGNLYVGNDTGVFISSDGGTTWNQRSGLPHAQVYQLAPQYQLPDLGGRNARQGVVGDPDEADLHLPGYCGGPCSLLRRRRSP